MGWLVGLAVIVFLFTTETGVFLMLSFFPSLIIATITAHYIKGPGDSILVLGTLLGTGFLFALLKGWAISELRQRRRWDGLRAASAREEGSHYVLERGPVPGQLQGQRRVPFEEGEGF